MRDFRDAKAMAQTIRAALTAKGLKITIAESLELIAKAFGSADWNTLSAAIKAAEAEKTAEPALPPPDSNAAFDRLAIALGWSDWGAVLAALRTVAPDQPGRRAPVDRGAPLEPQPAARTGRRFSPALEASLYRAISLATARRHGYTTLEHLLLALTDDVDAAAVMEACHADLGALRATLTRYIDEQLQSLKEMGDVENPAPTAGFHRVVQRSVIHVQSAGRDQVTGANLLVAIFSERESHACAFLEAQRMNRYDAVAFIAHGVRPPPPRKGGAAAPEATT
jgi:hypothetical protein